MPPTGTPPNPWKLRDENGRVVHIVSDSDTHTGECEVLPEPPEIVMSERDVLELWDAVGGE